MTTPSEGLVRRFHLGDVDGAADVASEAAVPANARDSVIEHRAVEAVAPSQAILDGERLLRFQRFEVAAHAFLPVVGMDTLEPAVTPLLLQRPSGELEPRAVEVDAAPIGPRHPDHDGGRVGHESEPVLALLERGLGLAAHKNDGEHLGQQAQALHQLLRPLPLDPEHADRERPGGGAADDEGHEHHRCRPERQDGGAVGHGLVGQLVGPGEADDVTVAETAGDPRELRGLEDPRHGSDPLPRPRVRDTNQALGGEHAEARAVDPEVFDDAAKAALDLLIGLVSTDLEETGAEVG